GVHPSSTGSSSRSRSPFSPAVNDGVFSNLFAKPTTDTTDNIPRVVKEFEQLEPPTYTETIADQPAPAYGETTVVMAATSISEDGEFLIEGMPVGDGFTFFVNFLIAAAFDFVGFLVTAMLATSHAARAGARVGLGLTLFRYAAMISGRLADEEASKGYDPYDPSNPDQDDVPQGIWLPTFLSVLGTIIAMRGLADYIYAKRMETVFRASSEPVPV
ncbi:uncharacterized protein EV422DRAFT_489847, partial [Fimicolochytrium jonesii]|uniref:uncharacterized protein n=1 Tax=Fimicolochytrium jonesii TaxID=1396493 RepID=UPI0022FF1FAC